VLLIGPHVRCRLTPAKASMPGAASKIQSVPLNLSIKS
jgi:hypothetical protein